MTDGHPQPAHPVLMAADLAQKLTTEATAPANSSAMQRPEPALTTARLIIRGLYPPDAPHLVRICEPPSVTRYMSLAFAYPYTLTHAENWIKMNLEPPVNHFVICEADRPDLPVGGIGIRPGTDIQSHAGEVGYWLAEHVRGKGYMLEALEGIVEWGFGKTEGGRQYKKLWADVVAENTASMRVLEKAGFTKEGILKGHVEKHGVTMDLHVYGLTKADWEVQMS